MDIASSLDGRKSENAVEQAVETSVDQLVAQVDVVMQQISTTFNATERGWYNSYEEGISFAPFPKRIPSFNDPLGFASYYGLHNYVSQSITLLHHPPEVLDYLLICAVTGLTRFCHRRNELTLLIVGGFHTINTLLHCGAKPHSRTNMLPFTPRILKFNYRVSSWAKFLMITFRIIHLGLDLAMRLPWLPIWMSVVSSFVMNDADVNTGVFTTLECLSEGYKVYIGLEESPLSLIYRNAVRGANPSFEEFCQLLQSRGGVEHRRCLLICFCPSNRTDGMENKWYQISQNMSYLLSGCIRESSREFLEGVIQEVKASQTAANIVADPSTFILLEWDSPAHLLYASLA